MDTVTLRLTIEVTPEQGQYTAVCPELGTASCGDDVEEAVENLKEATILHLETLAEFGRLESYLEERSVSVVQNNDIVQEVYVTHRTVQIHAVAS